uniref:CCHC-type domain-containing protein n=1 Tax=Chromera velia CCMP2878 TaxID=1169474 RepID=A0A0G4FRC8_9ALVE|eukprot:Cvel_3658.t1-p1 / transcript=Cvel_3658.t1 / gene=Cvel_3658 / organism=Chromera_velia_CCMP2878 / gene_product=hypothetical protein / transcript_product=hypothetical protein / location=Cvel_scaffold151:72277-79342(-) / protein_length=280 / sequence_SO=supercontig / SO=protein_coding / is_pseudo=false
MEAPQLLHISKEQWARRYRLTLLKAARISKAFKQAVRRHALARRSPRKILRALKEEFLSNLLTRQITIDDRIRAFPCDIMKKDKNGNVLKPKMVFRFRILKKRLTDLQNTAHAVSRDLDDGASMSVILHALTNLKEQKERLISLAHSSDAKIPLNLNYISWSDLKPHFDWLTSLEEAEYKGKKVEEKKDKAARGFQKGKGQKGANKQSEQKSRDQRPDTHTVYQTCGRKHLGECWGKKVTCKTCGEKGHFASAPICEKNGGKKDEKAASSLENWGGSGTA